MCELIDLLTPAELRAAQMQAQCQSRAVTASKLGMSQTTVRRLLQNARRRLLKSMSDRDREYYGTPEPKPRRIRIQSLSEFRQV